MLMNGMDMISDSQGHEQSALLVYWSMGTVQKRQTPMTPAVTTDYNHAPEVRHDQGPAVFLAALASL